MVRPLIGYPRNVMGLEIWLTFVIVEWRVSLATFAFAVCSPKHVYADGFAPLINGPFSF